jgi:hypothetical protein
MARANQCLQFAPALGDWRKQIDAARFLPSSNQANDQKGR